MAQRRGMGGFSAGHMGGMSGGAVFRGGSTFRGGMGFNNGFILHNSHIFPQRSFFSPHFFPRNSFFHSHNSFAFSFGFPAFGFGYPYYGYGYPGYAYYPPIAVTPPPGAGSYEEGGYENGTGRSEVYWLLALKDGSVVLATGYWLEDSTMHYVTREGKHLQVDLSGVDMDLTRKLNEERGLHFQLPRPTGNYEPKRYDAYGRVIASSGARLPEAPRRLSSQ